MNAALLHRNLSSLSTISQAVAEKQLIISTSGFKQKSAYQKSSVSQLPPPDDSQPSVIIILSILTGKKANLHTHVVVLWPVPCPLTLTTTPMDSKAEYFKKLLCLKSTEGKQ